MFLLLPISLSFESRVVFLLISSFSFPCYFLVSTFVDVLTEVMDDDEDLFGFWEIYSRCGLT